MNILVVDFSQMLIWECVLKNEYGWIWVKISTKGGMDVKVSIYSVAKNICLSNYLDYIWHLHSLRIFSKGRSFMGPIIIENSCREVRNIPSRKHLIKIV